MTPVSVKTRCRPSKGRRYIPDVSYRWVLRPTLMLITALHESNSISNLLKKKNQVLGLPCCSTREDLFIDVSITNIDEDRVISFLGVRTDRLGFGILIIMKTCRHTKNFNSKLGVSCQSLYASRMTGKHSDAWPMTTENMRVGGTASSSQGQLP